MVESDERKEETHQSDHATGESRRGRRGCCSSAEPDRLSSLPCAASKVGLPQVARVLAEVYGDRMASHDGESFPLQQKLLVCCLLLLVRSGKTKEVALGKVGGLLEEQLARFSPADPR